MDNSISYEAFVANVRSVEAEIARACSQCGRSPAEVTLMAVTKTHGHWAVEYAQRYGLKCVGENRVQEAEAKRVDRSGTQCEGIRWELIGSLQSNKARHAVALFERVQSVDRAKLALALDKYAGDAGRVLPVLLQINAGRDPAKHGAEIEDAPQLLETALSCANLKVEGLMTIAPLSDDPDVAARCFDSLRTVRDELAARFGVALSELSMGMSGDIPQAVRAGSTMLRVGTALFGGRV